MSINLLGRATDGSTVTLREPSSMVITRGWDTPVVMLEITFPRREETPDLVNIQLNHGEEVLFFGYCDEIIRSVDGDGATVTIAARSPGALLVDCEAAPATYTNLTATQFFNAELRPLGFTDLTLPNTTAAASQFQLNKGYSIWEAFRQVCFRLYGRYPHITSSNGIAVAAVTDENALVVDNDPLEAGALRWCSLEYITRRSSVVSSITYRDNNGNYTGVYTNPFDNSQLVNRRRYVIPRAEFAQTPALDPYQRILKGELGLHSARLTLPGLINLWPGQAIRFTDAACGTRTMAVYQSKIIYNGTGCRTRLVLARPALM